MNRRRALFDTSNRGALVCRKCNANPMPQEFEQGRTIAAVLRALPLHEVGSAGALTGVHTSAE